MECIRFPQRRVFLQTFSRVVYTNEENGTAEVTFYDSNMKALKHFVFIVLTFSLFQNFLFTQVYWIQKQSPVNTWLLKCSFADTLNGWAVGAFGRVYKFNKETIGIKNGGENSPVSFNLY